MSPGFDDLDPATDRFARAGAGAAEWMETSVGPLAADVVIPRIDGERQPMHMVVRRAPALLAVRTALASGEHRLFAALLAVHPHEVEADDLRAQLDQTRGAELDAWARQSAPPGPAQLIVRPPLTLMVWPVM